MCALKAENMCTHSRYNEKDNDYAALAARSDNSHEEDDMITPSLRSSTTTSTSSDCLFTPQSEIVHPFDQPMLSTKSNKPSLGDTADHRSLSNALEDSLLLLSSAFTDVDNSPAPPKQRHRGSVSSPFAPSAARKELSIYPSVDTSLLLASTATKNNIHDAISHRRPPQGSKSVENNATIAALHISRYLPQNQAVITTQDNWRISIANNSANQLLSGLNCTVNAVANVNFIGRHILDFIAPSHKTLLLEKIVRRREEEDDNRLLNMSGQQHGTVLICGDTIPIVKQDGSKSSVSLWLKEKKNELSSSTFFIWILEEVVQTTFKIKLDEHDCIIPSSTGSLGEEEEAGDSDDDDAEAFQFLLGYSSPSSATEFFHQPIQTVLPHFKTSLVQPGTVTANHGSQTHKFFGCRTKHDAHFPVMITATTSSAIHSTKTLRITSMPILADLVTVDRTSHVILSCNTTFAKHLFGYDEPATSLVQNEIVTMDKVMPEFSTLVRCLERDELLLDDGYTLNSTMCRDILHANSSGQSKRTSSPPYLTVQHRDGTRFEIDLQIKLMDKTKYALWITFDRDLVLKRHGHTTSYIHKKQQAQFDREQDEKSIKTNIIRAKSVNLPSMHKKSISSSGNSSSGAYNKNAEKQEKQQRKRYVRKREGSNGKNGEVAKVSSNVTSYSRPTFTPTSSNYELPSTTATSSPSLSRHRYTNSFSSMSIFQSNQSILSSPSSAAASANSSISAGSATAANRTTCPKTSNVWPRVGEYSAQTLKVSINDYEIIDELGQGAYGYVKLAYLKSDPTRKRVVIKYVIKSRILVDCWTRDRTLGLIPAEIHVLHTLRKIPHVNCSDMLDYFEDDEHYYVVMDLYGAGIDLFDYIELNEHLKEEEIKSIFRQVALAVAHLHAHHIVHRDIKDENVILDMKGGVRLIDFGSASYVKQGRPYETFVGTLDYAAPEILLGQTYAGPPQDIWACGTLLYTLIYRENPFYNIEEILDRELRIPFKLSEDSVDLIKKMLNRDVNQRINIQQVLNHPWLKTD